MTVTNTPAYYDKEWITVVKSFITGPRATERVKAKTKKLKGEIFDACRISLTRLSGPKRCSDYNEEIFLFAPTVNLFGAEIRVAEMWQASKIFTQSCASENTFNITNMLGFTKM